MISSSAFMHRHTTVLGTSALRVAVVYALVFPTTTLIAATAIAAEKAGMGLEEIVVTATRREQSLQDVPLSVSALSAETLVARGVNSLGDLQPGAIPGMMITQFSGTPSQLSISVRGVSIADSTQGTQELPVPVYIDGVFLGRAQGLGLDLIEPERIEVLRGPQGQLFGRNAEGGVVQYVSRKPSGEARVRASASFGNYDDQRYRLAIDLPKVAGFSTQFTALKAQRDGFSFNGPHGRYARDDEDDYAYLDNWGVRGAIRWENDGGNVVADYSYDYSKGKDAQAYLQWVPANFINPVTGAPVTPSSRQAPSTDYPDRHLDGGPFYNQGFDLGSSGHALTLAWTVSDAITLKSISAYRKVHRYGGGTLAYALPVGANLTTFQPLFTAAEEGLDQNQTSQELQFIGLWQSFDLTAGLIYYNEEVEDTRIPWISGPGLIPSAPGAVNSIAPSALQFCLNNDPCQTGFQHQNAKTDSYGAYAQANFRPTNALELTVGLRYTDDKKEALRDFNFVPVNIPAEFSASRVDPAASVKYQWTDNLNVYLRYATGYRAGGANVRSAGFRPYEEEENEAWELGMKSFWWDNRLSLNVALFHNTVKGAQITIQEAPNVNPSLTNTVNLDDDLKYKGVELEMSVAPIESLNVGINLTYMDRDEFNDIPNPVDPTLVTRFWTIHAPEYTGSILVDYSLPLPTGRLALHGDYTYADDYWATPLAPNVATLGPNFERPAEKVDQLGARVAWTDIALGNDSTLEVALWGKNLADDSSSVFSFLGCAGGLAICTFRTPPRTYGAEVRFRYR